MIEFVHHPNDSGSGQKGSGVGVGAGKCVVSSLTGEFFSRPVPVRTGGQEVDGTRKSHETRTCEAMASVLMTTTTAGINK